MSGSGKEPLIPFIKMIVVIPSETKNLRKKPKVILMPPSKPRQVLAEPYFPRLETNMISKISNVGSASALKF